MSAFRIDITRERFSMTFTGSYDEQHEPDIAQMVAAMREGLEANGYDVTASLTLSSTFEV